MKESSYSVNLNRETYDQLQKVRGELASSLGFEPTNGQVVRHLIALYFNETEWPTACR
jgi:hypothetical protein